MDRLARMLPYVNKLSPSVIVIDIGTNDVCTRIVIPERLARQIVDVAVMFSGVSSFETVVITPILQRVLAASRRPMREDFNDARLIVNRKLAAIVAYMPGVYNWKQRCIRLHPEESRSHSYGHAWCLYLETEMHPPSSRGKLQP